MHNLRMPDSIHCFSAVWVLFAYFGTIVCVLYVRRLRSFKSWIYMCVRQIVFSEFDRQRVVKKSSSLRRKKELLKSLARRFDKSRSYIDSRYSQLREKFKKYAAYWLARNGEMETVSARD